MTSDDVRSLARLTKQQARRVEREAHILRQLAARLEEAATDTPGGDTDEREAESSAYAAAV